MVGLLKFTAIFVIVVLTIANYLIISQLTVIVTTEAYARNITVFIDFNEKAIKEDTYLGDVWWTVDGKNYSNSNYDMSDAVYGDSSEPDFTDRYSDELMVSDNASKICFEEREQDPEYKVCDYTKPHTTEMYFTYPASWQPDRDED